MFSLRLLSIVAGACALVFTYDPQIGFNTKIDVETRSLDQIYQAALKEGGTITLWHGGDESNSKLSSKAPLKLAFQA
jgi:hypothetical protein